MEYKNITCAECGKQTMLEKKVTIDSYWGDFKMRIENAPAMECKNDKNIVFDMKIARFIQNITIFFSENRPNAKSFSMENMKVFCSTRKSQKSFIELLKEHPNLISNKDNTYSINKTQAFLLTQYLTKSKEAVQDLQSLAARDDKISDADVNKMSKYIQEDMDKDE